jgi:hypothetical protein
MSTEAPVFGFWRICDHGSPPRSAISLPAAWPAHGAGRTPGSRIAGYRVERLAQDATLGPVARLPAFGTEMLAVDRNLREVGKTRQSPRPLDTRQRAPQARRSMGSMVWRMRPGRQATERFLGKALKRRDSATVISKESGKGVLERIVPRRVLTGTALRPQVLYRRPADVSLP